MTKKKIILVADTAFIDAQVINQHQLVSVFPREKGDGAFRTSYADLLHRSKLQSEFYSELLPKLMPIFWPYMQEAREQAKHFVRPALVRTTSMFIDRALRVLHRIEQLKDEMIFYAQVEPIEFISLPDDIKQNWHFNQDIIRRISSALNIESFDIFDQPIYPEYPHEHLQKNLLFRPEKSGPKGALIKVMNRFYRYKEKFSNKNAKFQNIGFGPDKFYLAKRGLIGPFGYFQAPLILNLNLSPKNEQLRREILQKLEKVIAEDFKYFFLKLTSQLDSFQMEALAKAFSQLLIDYFPTAHLEGLSSNLQNAKKTLQLNKVSAVIGHDVMTQNGFFVSVAARLAGKEIIGVQHGGHYGYIEDMSLAAQFEYYFYDKFLTWGWDRIDDHLPQCKTIPLPSPKLSEKPLSADYFSHDINQRDILFFSNLFHRFPHISTCGQSRPDFIDEISSSQEQLIQALANEALTISHKPFSMRFVDLYPDHFRRLEQKGGNYYQLLKSVHKGITSEYIKTCKIIIWDQIGSGTLECLTSEVPTMIFWQRIYSHESQDARTLVANLENVGVVHRDPIKMSKEIKLYLKDPKGWMENPERQLAIKAFCQKFALVDEKWDRQWKQWLISN